MDDLNALEFNDIGRWPMAFRAGLIAIIFFACLIGGYWHFVITKKVPELEAAVALEETKRQEFAAKQRKAANLEAYKRQLADMETNFGAMLRQLPGKTEIPSLLVDISQTGLASGLDEELFQPGVETRREVFAEKPITIRLSGGYHELAEFVSGIAALPRIVVLNDVSIVAGKSPADDLTMSVTAKTFRYLDDDEGAGE
ncbi:MAG: type 4a pilus biogenesis protein PilO [Gammaproteobacteria bacterium]|nr:type 4a pilus biogenesis protein PilO [Gammaproteobacteria bacterium]